MIAHVRRVMTSSTRPLKRGNTAGDQPAGRRIVIDPGNTGDVNRFRIENFLAARDCGSRIRLRKRRPRIKGVEDCRAELAITRCDQPSRLFERWNQWIHTGVHAYKKWLAEEAFRSAVCAQPLQESSVVVECLGRREAHFKINDLLLLCRS